MERELSGCDWCCGGGDAARVRLRAAAERAERWLRERGVAVEPLALCRVCGYNAPADNGLCIKCNSVPSLARWGGCA